MAFGSLDNQEDNAPLAEINMVPLIDVMLVLLVIFIVAAPMLTHAVKVDLPKAASRAQVNRPDAVTLSIDAAQQLFWNGQAVTNEELAVRLQQAAAQPAQPELHIRADRQTPYEKVAQVMSRAASLGVSKIGFVTDPSMVQP
jgi:biopolymer transport protein ExbD